MYCIKCGKEIDNTSIFCPFCGTKAAKPAEPENSISLEQVQQKITDVYNENAPKVKEALNTAGEKAEKLYQENAPKVREALNTAADKASETAETIRQTVARQAPEVTRKVKSSKVPLIALAVALVCALGFGIYKVLTAGPTIKRFEQTAEKYETRWGEGVGVEYSDADEYYFAVDPVQVRSMNVLDPATWDNGEFVLGEFATEQDAKEVMAYERENLGADDDFVYENKGGKEILRAEDYYGMTIGLVRRGKNVLFYFYTEDLDDIAEEFIKDVGF